jgi:hypothetical protein
VCARKDPEDQRPELWNLDNCREGRCQAEVAREALERYVAAAGALRLRSLGAFTQDPPRGDRVRANNTKRWVHEPWRRRARPSDRGEAPNQP